MGRIIEAKAVISAEDRTGRVLDGIARKFKDVGKGAKVASEVGRLSKELDGAARGLRDIERFRGAQASFAQARTTYRSTQAEVARIAQGLEAARKAASAFDGVKAFSKSGMIAAEISASRKQVAELERQFVTAQRAVKAASSAYESQAAALKGVKGELGGAGINVGKLVAEQNRLKAAVEGANAALVRQGANAHAEGRVAAGMSAAGGRQAARIAQGRYLAEGMSAPGRAEAERTRAEAEAHRQALIDAREVRSDARRALAGGAGLYLGHKVHEGTHATLETYRDFDRYKRQTQAFGNFDDADTARIVAMAIHGGASTRYNDIQWLQGAKALGGRGVKAGSVMSILPEAAQYGQAMGTNLPDAVAGLEGSLFTFRRDLSTPEKARAAARRTADLQVTAAKSFGLTHNDLVGGYELGGLGAEMSGLGEEKLLAFLGLGKKLNIDGHAQGNAFNAMTAKFLAPTRKGREALAGVGIDYGARQQMPERLSVDNFANMIAQQYGVRLDAAGRGKLDKAFGDKSVFTDPSAFAVAVKDALQGQVGITGARDANKVAGSAERFRQNNVEKVDVNGLFNDIMAAVKDGNLALANSIWGEKQGKRIMAALRDGDLWNEALRKIEQTPEGKAKGVADKMNAGFDGAMARLEGATKNLETAFGRSWDDDGKGGFLTNLTDAAAKATQALAEMPKPVLQAGSAIAWLGGKVATGAGTLALVGAAFSLKSSAGALTAAAARLGMNGRLGKVPGGAIVPTPGGATVPAPVVGGTVLGPLGVGASIVVGGAVASVIAKNAVENEAFADPYLQGGILGADPAGYGLGAAIVHADKLPGSQAPRAIPSMLGGGTPGGLMPSIGSAGASFGLNGPRDGGAGIVPSAPIFDVDKIAAAKAELAAYRKELAALVAQLEGLKASGEATFSPETSGLDARVEELRQKVDRSGQAAALHNTLDGAASASATAANGGKPIEASVKPDQITAKVTEIPPVTGEATVTLQPQRVIVELNSDMLSAKIAGAVSAQTAKMPLTSSGARPGAVSMPGAATTPGAK